MHKTTVLSFIDFLGFAIGGVEGSVGKRVGEWYFIFIEIYRFTYIRRNSLMYFNHHIQCCHFVFGWFVVIRSTCRRLVVSRPWQGRSPSD